MSAATKVKTAKARAGIAARLLMNTKRFHDGGHGLGRSFDDCFEMFDGAEVMRILCDKIRGSTDLAKRIIYHYGPNPSGDMGDAARECLTPAVKRK